MHAQKKNQKGDVGAGMSAVEQLRLRVSAMIHSPKAQAECQATIWRLERDTDPAWRQVMDELAETDGLQMTVNEDGTVLLQWEAANSDELPEEGDDLAPDVVVQRLHEEPAPF